MMRCGPRNHGSTGLCHSLAASITTGALTSTILRGSMCSKNAGPQYAGMLAHIGRSGLTNAVSKKYRVDAEGPVYGAEGKPTEKFG